MDYKNKFEIIFSKIKEDTHGWTFSYLVDSRNDFTKRKTEDYRWLLKHWDGSEILIKSGRTSDPHYANRYRLHKKYANWCCEFRGEQKNG